MTYGQRRAVVGLVALALVVAVIVGMSKLMGEGGPSENVSANRQSTDATTSSIAPKLPRNPEKLWISTVRKNRWANSTVSDAEILHDGLSTCDLIGTAARNPGLTTYQSITSTLKDPQQLEIVSSLTSILCVDEAADLASIIASSRAATTTTDRTKPEDTVYFQDAQYFFSAWQRGDVREMHKWGTDAAVARMEALSLTPGHVSVSNCVWSNERRSEAICTASVPGEPSDVTVVIQHLGADVKVSSVVFAGDEGD